MNDFSRLEPSLHSAQLEAMRRVAESGWLILGREVERFEQNFAAASGSRHTVGTANGLDSIEIILRALDIGEGDEVITTGMTAVASVLGILRAGAVPVLADVLPHSALLDPESVARCISSRTKAVMPVHLYGCLADMTALQAICRAHDLILIEDCAQAHLASRGGLIAGSFGAAGAYSFYPTKNLGALGDAGAVVTNDDRIAERCRRIRNYGQSSRYHHPELGLNSRLDELQAAVLTERLTYLAAWTKRRREVAAAYRAGIANDRVNLPPPTATDEEHVYHLFVVTSAARDKLQQHLEESGVQTLIHYPLPMHEQPPLRDLCRDRDGLAATQRHAAECLSIPCHPYLADDDVDHVIETVNSFRD